MLRHLTLAAAAVLVQADASVHLSISTRRSGEDPQTDEEKRDAKEDRSPQQTEEDADNSDGTSTATTNSSPAPNTTEVRTNLS